MHGGTGHGRHGAAQGWDFGFTPRRAHYFLDVFALLVAQEAFVQEGSRLPAQVDHLSAPLLLHACAMMGMHARMQDACM